MADTLTKRATNCNRKGGITMKWYTLGNIFWGNDMPEDVPIGYHSTKKDLVEVRKRLKNPVYLRGGGRPLPLSNIRQLESQERSLLKTAEQYRTLIKYMIKYNLLPLNKQISGKESSKFIFTLGSMIEFPFFDKVVYYANELTKLHFSRAERQEVESNFLLLIQSLETAIRELKERKLVYRQSRPKKPSKSKNSNGNVYSLADYR